jgi:hypothetical protein
MVSGTQDVVDRHGCLGRFPCSRRDGRVVQGRPPEWPRPLRGDGEKATGRSGPERGDAGQQALRRGSGPHGHEGAVSGLCSAVAGRRPVASWSLCHRWRHLFRDCRRCWPSRPRSFAMFVTSVPATRGARPRTDQTALTPEPKPLPLGEALPSSASPIGPAPKVAEGASITGGSARNVIHGLWDLGGGGRRQPPGSRATISPYAHFVWPASPGRRSPRRDMPSIRPPSTIAGPVDSWSTAGPGRRCRSSWG